MASLTERLEWIITANPDKAIAGFKAVGAAADESLGKAETRMQTASSSMLKFGAGAVAASAVAVAGLAKLAGKFEETGVEVGKFAAITSVSAENASRWVKVSGDMGLSATDVSAAMNKMNIAAATHSKEFDKLGISVARAKDGAIDTNQTFLNTIDVLHNMASADERATAGKALFGKGWTSVATIVEAGAASMKASMAEVKGGELFSSKDVDQARAYQKTTAELGDSFKALAIDIGQGVAPVLGGVAKAVTAVVNGFDSLNAVTGGLVGQAAGVVALGVGFAGLASVVAGAGIKMATNLSAAGDAISGLAVKLGIKSAAEVSDAAATSLSATANTAAVGSVEARAAALATATAAQEADAVAAAFDAAAVDAMSTSDDLAIAAAAQRATATAAATVASEADAVAAAMDAAAMGQVASASDIAAAAKETQTAATEANTAANEANAASQVGAGAGVAGLGPLALVAGVAITHVTEAVAQNAREQKQLKEIKAFDNAMVDMYTKSIQAGTGAVAALKSELTQTGEIVVRVASTKIDWGNSFTGAKREQVLKELDLAPILSKNGVSVEQFGTAVEGGAAKISVLSDALKANHASTKDIDTIIGAATTSSVAYANATTNSKDLTALLGGALDSTTASTTDATASTTDLWNAQVAAGAAAATLATATDAVNKAAANSANRSADVAAARATEAANTKALKDAYDAYAVSLRKIESTAVNVDSRVSSFTATMNATAAAASGVQQANEGYSKSYDDLSDSLKKNGATLDTNTVKGRANVDAFTAVGAAVRTNLGQQLKDANGNYSAVTKSADEYRASLYMQLATFGVVGPAADAYIQTLGLTPEQITTDIRLTGQAEAHDKLNTLNFDVTKFTSADTAKKFTAALDAGDFETAWKLVKAQVENPPGSVIPVTTSGVASAIKTIAGVADSAGDQPAVVVVTADTIPAQLAIAALGVGLPRIVVPVVPGHAAGTVGAAAGLAMVGEHGPELVVFKGGEQVLSAAQTRSMGTSGLRGYAGGAGLVQNVTYVTTPAAVSAASPAAAAGPTATQIASDAATAAAAVVTEEDRIQAARYKTGRISLAAYRDYVKGRLAASVDLSNDYLNQYDLVNQLNDTEQKANDAALQAIAAKKAAMDKATADAKAAADQAVSDEDARQKAMYETGVTTLAQYEDYLKSRLGSYQTYSAGWLTTWQQIKGLDDKAIADAKAASDQRIKDDAAALDKIVAQYKQAQLEKDVIDAGAAQAAATRAALDAGGTRDQTLGDRKATDQDKAKAEQAFTDSQSKLGDDTYRTSLAQAAATGLTVGSIEWDRMMRALLTSAIDNFNANGLGIAAGVLAGDREGIPNLAAGGVIRASRGGTLLRAGEAGRDEAIVPLDAGFGGDTFHITVNAQSLTGKIDPRTADMLVEAITQAQRRNGRSSLTKAA